MRSSLGGDEEGGIEVVVLHVGGDGSEVGGRGEMEG